MKMAIRFAFAAAILIGATQGWAQGDAKAGKAIYDKSCATCHSADGTPKEAIAKMLKAEMKHLGTAEIQAKSDGELLKAVTEGAGKMKAVKGVAGKDAANVVAFVRTLKK